MRIGAKKRPFYRVVAIDERKKRTGAYLELLGTYNPLTEPKEIILKKDRIDDWIKKGAVLSDGYLRITGQAPQKPPRKPKKQVESNREKTTVGKTETESEKTADVVEESKVEETAEKTETEKNEPGNQ